MIEKLRLVLTIKHKDLRSKDSYTKFSKYIGALVKFL